MGKAGGRITNEIRALRFHSGEMTQQELADRVGVTRQTVNAIEGNESLAIPRGRVPDRRRSSASRSTRSFTTARSEARHARLFPPLDDRRVHPEDALVAREERYLPSGRGSAAAPCLAC